MGGARRKALRILVIEDNNADTEMIRIYLEEARLSNKLETAESLAEGLALIDEQEETEQIDIVLLDLGLPDSTGFNTLRLYLKSSPKIPVVVMTGLNDQRKGTESVRAGAQDYLVKGEFNATQLLKVIRYSMERFRLHADAEKRASKFSEEKSRLKELQQMVSMGDWEMDIVNNAMNWSEELFQIFEEPQTYAPSLSDYLRMVYREDKEKVTAFFGQAVKEDEYGPLEHRILIDNRIVKQLSLRTRIKFDEKTNRVLLMGSVQDITPRAQVDKLQPTSEGTEEENTDGTIYNRELFNQISFNIRTPLSTAVHLFYLLEQTNLNNHQSRLVQDLKTTIDDLSFTLSNLINLSTLSNDSPPVAQDQFRPLDILESIQRVMNFKAQQNNRELDIYLDPHLSISVNSDSNKLAQLFFTMMELAFYYSQEASFLKLRCTLEEGVDNLVTLAVQLEYTGRLPLWPVSDQAVSAEELFLLLQPKGAADGREQLLASVFQRLCVEFEVLQQTSETTGGVFLDLRIPLTKNKKEVIALPLTPEKPLSILLVEDHPMHQITTRKVLTTWSDMVTVTIASNGQQAVHIAKETSFDIILMDLQMPIMDGMVATSNIRLFSKTPIIALTASTSKQEEDRCYQVGVNDYLAKPFQPADFYQRIMQLIYQAEPDND